MAPDRRTAPLDPVPEALSSALGKLVYLAVRQRGEATVVELRDALDVPQLRLYPTLDALAERGLLEREGEVVRLAERRSAAEPATVRA